MLRKSYNFQYAFFMVFVLINLVFSHLITTPVVSAEKSLGLEAIARTLESDEGQLRFIARIIFNRERSETFLATKMCTHGSTICEFWKNNRWQSMEAPARQALKKQIDEMKGSELPRDLNKDDIVSILKRPAFSMLSPDALHSYKELGNQAIEEGTITVDLSPVRQRYGIKVLFRGPHPVGTILEKALEESAGDIAERPTHTLMITFDIQDIVEKMARHEDWNHDADGTVTTLCPSVDES